MSVVDIKGLDKAKVLSSLYNATRPQGFGFLHDLPQDMSVEQAKEIIDARLEVSVDLYFDYVQGRPIKVDLTKDTFESRLYDRDAGVDKAQYVIDSLREEQYTAEHSNPIPGT